MSSFISPNIASSPDPLIEALLKEDIKEEWSNGIRHGNESLIEVHTRPLCEAAKHPSSPIALDGIVKE